MRTLSPLADDSPETVRILHVDDEPDVADLTATYLQREDDRFRIETATSASEGLDRFADEQFDCIISDYDMPGQNGIEFLEAVREEYPDLPFVLFTGKGSEEVASDAISAGVTDYLQKESGPDQYTVLANRVGNAVEQYRAKRDAEASRDRLSLFIEQSPLGVIEWNEEFEVARVNEAAERILGYAEEDLIGRSWEALVPDSDREPVAEVVSELLDAEGGYHSVNENVRKDGERIVCEWHNRVVTDDAGDTVAIFSQFQDVTEREERKRELEQYEAYLEESTDIITVLDESGTVKYQSPSVARILGYQQGGLIGQNGFEFLHPEDRDEAYAMFADLISEPGGTGTVEVRFRTADGDWRWLEVRGTNRLDQDPINGVVTNSRDITDRKERERKLESQAEELAGLTTQLEEQYRYLFEKAPVMAVLTRAEGGEPIIEECNQLFLDTLGYDRPEVIGRTLASFYTPESTKALLQQGGYDRALTGEFVREERELVTAAGETVETLLRAVPRRDTGNTDRGTLAMYIDIGERKQLERETDRLEEFTSIVSHDLRNPLNVAEGKLEMAREECDSPHLDGVARAHERMNALIDDLLTLARQGNRVSDIEPVDLAELVASCWENVETADATVRAGTDRTIRADRSRLAQLLENVVRNAVEHGGESVTVTVGELDDGFYVEDDGLGIPEDERDDVFDAGYSTAKDGTGFGLSIVEQVAAAHGWGVRVTEGSDGGARFEFTGVEIAE